MVPKKILIRSRELTTFLKIISKYCSGLGVIQRFVKGVWALYYGQPVQTMEQPYVLDDFILFPLKRE